MMSVLNPGEAVQQLRAAGIEIVRERTGDGSEIRCQCSHCRPDPHGHLYVNAVTGAAFCHRCPWRGNLATLCGHPPKELSAEEVERHSILAAAAAFYHSNLFGAEATLRAQAALHYLIEERALPLDMVRRFQVGWAEGGLMRHLLDEKGFPLEACIAAGVLKRHGEGRVRDFFYRRIICPNVVAGRVVHLSGRVIGDRKPKWLHLPGEITHPFNADALRHPECLWLEGIFDVMAAEAMGHPAAAGLGTYVKEEWLADTHECRLIRVCLDGDPAGQAGALKAAKVFGQRARIATLPEGKDPNDMLREKRQDEFAACLAAAEDLLTFEINRIPVGLPRPELREQIDEIIRQLAAGDPARSEAYLSAIKKRFRLTREEIAGYRQLIADQRNDIRRQAGSGKATTNEPTYTALFDGLVDIVEQEGQPAFLIAEDGGLRIADSVERDGMLLVPPPPDQIPWLLPRVEEVLRYYRDDSDPELYDHLVSYFTGISELPTEAHYHLQAAWTLHTYLLEQFQYSPYIWLYAVPERGKTRTGKAMTYVAYRAIHVESLRDPYIVRFAANLGGTIFFDVMNLWRKAEKLGSEDVLLGRFERGITVPRVNWPERGPHRDTAYYPIFGPTLIATNEAIHHILDTRAVTITMPQTRRRFETDVTPEAARPLRERLVAFRARHLGESLPDLDKPAAGRLGDILRPLVQIVRLVRPEREDVLRDLIRELQSERLTDKAQTLESELLQIMDSLRHKVDGGVLPVKAVSEVLNEDRPEKARISPQKVGKRLRSLGFAPGKRAAAGATVLWDEDKLVRAMEAYGLCETAQTAHSASQTGNDQAESAECVECAESAPGLEPDDAHTPSAPDEVASWPPEAREAFEERVAIMMADGMPPEEARRQALECVKREFSR